MPHEAAQQSGLVAEASGNVQPSEWLLQDIRAHVPAEEQQKVTPASVSLLQLTNQSAEGERRHAASELVAAFVKLGAEKGLFLLYAKRQGRYEAVYQKEERIKNLQFLDGNGEGMLSITTAGKKGEEDSLYLIRATADGYKEVWSGTANARHEDVTIDTVVGNLQVDDEGNLIYLQLKRTLDQTGTPIMEQSSARIFTYNEKKQHYEPK